jgi:hypothetical protein
VKCQPIHNFQFPFFALRYPIATLFFPISVFFLIAARVIFYDTWKFSSSLQFNNIKSYVHLIHRFMHHIPHITFIILMYIIIIHTHIHANSYSYSYSYWQEKATKKSKKGVEKHTHTHTQVQRKTRDPPKQNKKAPHHSSRKLRLTLLNKVYSTSIPVQSCKPSHHRRANLHP